MNDTNKKIYRLLLWVMSIYYLLTALWGLIDIDSFMQVTGPKTDIWLVKTVSVLLIPIVLCFISGLFFNSNFLAVMLVAVASAIGLAAIDFYYTANHTIKWVYALDGVAQCVFLLVWIYLLVQYRK